MEPLSEVLSEGGFCERLVMAHRRNEARKAQIGEEAFRAEMDAAREAKTLREMREERVTRVKRMIGPRHADCTFEGFAINEPNRTAFERCKQLAQHCGDEAKGVMLCGPNGIGKNHLAAATAVSLAKRGISSYVNSITGVKRQICDAFGTGVEEAVSRIMASRLIVINDLGAERDTDFARELMFGLIDRIYEEKRVLMVTTNIGSDVQLGQRYGRRVVSRLLALCDVVCYDDVDHRVGQ